MSAASVITVPLFDEEREAFGRIPDSTRLHDILRRLLVETAFDDDRLSHLQAVGEEAVAFQAEVYSELRDMADGFVSQGGDRAAFTEAFHRIARYGELRMVALMIGLAMTKEIGAEPVAGRA